MDRYFGILLIIALYSYCSLFDHCFSLECGEFTLPNNILETRIVNGEIATIGEFPWQVSIQRRVRVRMTNMGNVSASPSSLLPPSSSETIVDDDDEEPFSNELYWQKSPMNILIEDLLRGANYSDEQIQKWLENSSNSSNVPIISVYPPSANSSSSTPINVVIIEGQLSKVTLYPPLPTFPPDHVFPPPPPPPPQSGHIDSPKYPPSRPPPIQTSSWPTRLTTSTTTTRTMSTTTTTVHPFPTNSISTSKPPPAVSFPPFPSSLPPWITSSSSMKSSFPTIMTSPRPPMIITTPKHWTWSTASKPTMPPPIPTISRLPTWSPPSTSQPPRRMPPIILPIPTSAPRPRPQPSPMPPTRQPRPPITNQDWQWKWQHFCGGSIIDNQWIMTAAHCVESMKSIYSPGMIQIMAGSTNWRSPDTEHAVTIAVDRIIVHEGWRQRTGQNDIALLHLSRPISYVQKDKIYINNICLSRQTQHEYEGMVSSSGWGFVAKDNRITPELMRRVDLMIVDHNTCHQAFSRVIQVTTNQVCAGRSHRGNCMGDSGGPLILKDGNRAIQIGIVSFSIPCAVPGYPDVFTRVSKYIDWIAKNTGINFYG
ncbi:Testisin [Dermatophagoides farinae]|uniref:Testisin n=1 Tax=Dermatophagoides farinae TaxID=6954 RepID=A0A922HZN4_DERFA|nr:Testisin [Dermatophagoides farinae]